MGTSESREREKQIPEKCKCIYCTTQSMRLQVFMWTRERKSSNVCLRETTERERKEERERERRDFSAHNVLNEKSEKAIFVRLFYKKSFGKIVETHFHDLLLKQLR